MHVYVWVHKPEFFFHTPYNGTGINMYKEFDLESMYISTKRSVYN